MSSDPTVNALLLALLSSDNNTRALAEQSFNALKVDDGEGLVLGMLTCLRFSTTIALRSIAAVLLRQILVKEDDTVYSRMRPEAQRILKEQLIIALQSELDPNINQKVGDTIGELASILLEEDGWPEILSFCLAAVQGGSPQLRLSSLHIFRSLSYYISNSMQSEVGGHTLYQWTRAWTNVM
jgi:hypothetical protein